MLVIELPPLRFSAATVIGDSLEWLIARAASGRLDSLDPGADIGTNAVPLFDSSSSGIAGPSSQRSVAQ